MSAHLPISKQGSLREKAQKSTPSAGPAASGFSAEGSENIEANAFFYAIIFNICG
jgi:hypothetical protein